MSFMPYGIVESFRKILGGEHMKFRWQIAGLLLFGVLTSCGLSDHDRVQSWLRPIQEDRHKLENSAIDFQARISGGGTAEQKINELNKFGMEIQKYLNDLTLNEPPKFSNEIIQNDSNEYYSNYLDQRKRILKISKDLIYATTSSECCMIRDDIQDARQGGVRLKEIKQKLLQDAKLSDIEQKEFM